MSADARPAVDPTHPAVDPTQPPVDPTQPRNEGPVELDVRALPHGGRHEVIFGHLDALAAGESFVIRNDHDPKPLRYQTESLWPGAFEWSYLEAGPTLWRVEITRVG